MDRARAGHGPNTDGAGAEPAPLVVPAGGMGGHSFSVSSVVVLRPICVRPPSHPASRAQPLPVDSLA